MTQDIHRDRLLILDFGSQYTQLIARRIREVGVYCEIMPWDTDASDIRAFVPSGIILSGGPESVTAGDSPRAPDIVFALDVPLLGICYGMQTMAAQLGVSSRVLIRLSLVMRRSAAPLRAGCLLILLIRLTAATNNCLMCG